MEQEEINSIKFAYPMHVQSSPFMQGGDSYAYIVAVETFGHCY